MADGYISQITLPNNTAYDIKAVRALADENGNNIVNTYATQSTVNGLLAAANALVYKGTVSGNSSSNNGGNQTPAADCGDVYKVDTAGYIGGLYVEVGDMLICTTDNTIAGAIGNWNIIQTSEGSVSTSETSVVDGHIPLFNGTTGRFIKNSEKSFTTTAPSSSSEDSTIPTSKAVWSGITTKVNSLDVDSVGGETGEYISAISETDGKISATKSTTTSTITFTNGTTAGPTIKISVNGINSTNTPAIPSATDTISGIVTTTTQSFAGDKTFVNTSASTSTDTGAVKISGGLGVAGQVTATRLAANGSNTSYNLYVNGTSLLNGNTTVNGNIVPSSNNAKTLGASDARWSQLYIGSANSYGNAYQPIYWNSGVPTVTYPVQYSTWSISNGHNTATLTASGVFTANTYVIALVVTSGQANLNGPITWTSSANTLTLTTSAATSGAVEGYVLTAIGTASGATCVSSSSATT